MSEYLRLKLQCADPPDQSVSDVIDSQSGQVPSEHNFAMMTAQRLKGRDLSPEGGGKKFLILIILTQKLDLCRGQER